MEKLLKSALALFDKRSTLMVQIGDGLALMGERELDQDRLLYARWKAGEAQGPVVAVDASLFKEAIKRDTQVSLDGKVWVGEVGLECREVEFAMPNIEPQVWVSRKGLLASLEAVYEATDAYSIQAVFRGAQFEFSPTYLKLVASDRFVLAEHTIPLWGALEGKAVIHREGLALLMRALKGVEEFEVALGLSKQELGLKAGELEMSLTRMEGEYPDYERVIPRPEEWQTSVEVYVPALVEALEALSPLFLKDKSEARHRVDVQVEEGVIHLKVDNEHGQAHRSVPCIAQGTAEFSVNGQFFLERLQPVRGNGKLHVVDDRKPVIIEGGLYRGVVVPLRLRV
jgi:DNA polymerase III sliding clamp (beta) subunit (PCNA family)